MSNSSQAEKTHDLIWKVPLLKANHTFPFTINISPQNHSSAVKFELSYICNLSFFDWTELNIDSIYIQEKTVLKLR